MDLNREILVYLNNLSQIPWIEKGVYIFADFPIFLIPVFLVAMWIYANFKKEKKQKEQLLCILYSTIIAISLSLLIQQFVHIDRPENYLEQTGKLLLEHIPDASFPSDHASVSIAFLTSLYFFGFRKFFLLFLPLAIMMNLSRIIAGVHWPFDILAGTIIGIMSAYTSRKLLRKTELVKKLNLGILRLAGWFKL